MDKAEWISRCVAQYKERGGCNINDATEFAEIAYDSAYEDFPNFPEDAANEDMSYWTNDE